MTRAATQWTDDELLEYSSVHLAYEVGMVFQCAVLLSDPVSRLLVSPLVRNLLLEGFAIHLRGLMDFFSATVKDKDDVVADDREMEQAVLVIHSDSRKNASQQGGRSFYCWAQGPERSCKELGR